MKHTLLGMIAAWPLFAMAQQANEPNELSTLRESYNKARIAALAPVEKKYADALTSMKERFTKSGNLESALAVDAELKGLTKKGDNSLTVSSGASAEKEVPVVVGTRWKWDVEQPDKSVVTRTLNFLGSGRARIDHSDAQKSWGGWTWRIDASGKIYVKFGEDSQEAQFKISRNGTTAGFTWSGTVIEAELIPVPVAN